MTRRRWNDVHQVFRYYDNEISGSHWRHYYGSYILPFPSEVQFPSVTVFTTAPDFGASTAHLGRDAYPFDENGMASVEEAEPKLSSLASVREVPIHVLEEFYCDVVNPPSLIGPSADLIAGNPNLSNYVFGGNIALYYSPVDLTTTLATAAMRMGSLHLTEREVHEMWVRECLQMCDMLLVPGHDGESLHFAASSKESLSKSLPLLQTVAEKVRATNWFRQNERYLYWDEEYAIYRSQAELRGTGSRQMRGVNTNEDEIH